MCSFAVKGLKILSFAVVCFVSNVISIKDSDLRFVSERQKENIYPDSFGRAVALKEWRSPPSDWESLDAKHRHTKAYLDFLRQHVERQPAGLRMSKSPLQSGKASSPLGCPNDSCSPSDNIILSKHHRQQLLLQLITFLQPERLILVTNERDKDVCIRMGRFLYKSNTPASCSTFKNLYGYYHDVVIFANDKDNGKEISQKMMIIGKRITKNQLTIDNILVFLPLSNTVLRPPEYRLRYCVLQVKGDGVEFKEVFTFGSQSTVPAEEVVGWWRPDKPNGTYVPWRGDLAVPRNFQGNVVRIVMFEVMPYIALKKTLDGKVETYGYLSEVCKLVAKELNFTIEWVVTPDGEFGIPGEDGAFTGTAGVLQRKEAEISAVPLNIDINRAEVIDFSPPIDYAYIKLLIYREYGKEDIDWKTYVTGFHWLVWLSVLGTWFLMAVGLVFVANRDLDVTVYNYLFTFIGTLAQQGSSYEPQCTRGRIVFLSFWLASVLIYASYTASLTSQLAVINTVDPFTNLKEALTTAGYSVVIQKGTSYYTNVKSMAKRDESMKLFYQQLVDKSHLKVSNNAEGIKLVQQGKYAFFQDTVSVNYDLKNNCSFSWLGPAYFAEFASMGYMKKLTFANVISEIIARATDSGITRKLMKKWMGQKATCQSSPFQDLGFSKTVSAFSLLVLGLVLAAVLLLVEMWVHSGSLFQSRERHSRRGKKIDQIKIKPCDLSLRHEIR